MFALSLMVLAGCNMENIAGSLLTVKIPFH